MIRRLTKIRVKITLALLSITLVFWLSFLYWINKRQESIMLNYLRHQAEGIYNTVILSRHWIASKGGIYLKTEEGYKLVTPSHFVAELTNFAKGSFPYKIKIAVENSENPEHIPDEFETKAIKKIWDEKHKAYWELVSYQGKKFFKYAAPLRFKSECRHCHMEYDQKSKGCISISFPATSIYKELAAGKAYTYLLSIGAFMLIFSAIYLLLNRTVLNPLRKFINASEAVEKGDLGVRVRIDSHDEWKLLADRFNSMIEKIAEHQKELEDKIRKATAELQRAYEELKQTERFKTEFFSNITHDLKTPITAIKGAADLLIRKDNHPYGFIIMKNVEKLHRMVDDILDSTRLEHGQLELNKEEGDIVDLIEDTIFAVSPLAMEKETEIKFECRCNGRCTVHFDKTKLSRALANVIVNAIKFSPEKSEVKVILKEDNGCIHIAVEDHGPGIPDEDREKIFQKFYKSNNGGIGLGLFIAKGIVEAHGGKIWVSKPEGHTGTVFNITLPKV